MKVVYPSNPADAKGLLLAAFDDPNPVLFFEHKTLYRQLSGAVPDGFYTTEIGKATVSRQSAIGSRQEAQLSIVTYGMGVHWATKAAVELGIDAEIVDLRSLVPLDYDAIAESVRRTNRVLVLHEDNLFGGLGGEIAAWIGENLFENLDAPVLRVASLDMPIPFAAALEKIFLPENRLREAMEKLVKY